MTDRDEQHTYDFRVQRLFVGCDMAAGAEIALEREQANYLLNVLRLADGAPIHIFNGRDGEWRASVHRRGKRDATLQLVSRTRSQAGGPDLHYLFAPLKRSRLDYMVQKATELGVSRLQPVMTQHTIAERVNLERMRANVIEAAEQCGILCVPEVVEPMSLQRLLDAWPQDRLLVFCDEDAPIADPIEALQTVRPRHPAPASPEATTYSPDPPLAVLIGPEGGFSTDEREKLIAAPFTLRLALGPRIMRADTAAVAALALVNAVLGDWRG